MPYHVPVLLKESIQGLDIHPDGIYVDVTFGGGGHSREILKELGNGRLIAFDQDSDAESNFSSMDNPNITFIAGNFRHLRRYLKLYGIDSINGLLADLGISSYHIDQPDRGFSTRFEGVLDMRMDKNSSLTARDIVNDYSRDQLQRVFTEYGEIRNAKALTQEILRSRVNNPLNTTTDLVNLLNRFVKSKNRYKYFAQVFQALRIEVNDEINALKKLLGQTSDLLVSGGRMAVIAYHSLEDRLVKNFINKGNFEGKVEKDIYGNFSKPMKAVNRKPITPSQEEISLNPRARSAKLRIAEKI